MGRRLGWRPGPGTAVAATIALAFNLWVFSPTWWHEVGADSRDFYAAGRVAASGGNPYDTAVLFAEEDRLYNRGLAPTDPGYYHHNPYGYPPLFTVAIELGSGLGLVGFIILGVAVSAAAGIAGLELLLAGLAWRRRAWPRLFFIGSAPLALAVFVGNPSTLLLLFWSAAFLALRRSRPWLAGAVLTGCLLKLPVGLPAAAALFACAGTARWRLLGGLAAGTATAGVLSLVLTGPAGMVDWVRGLSGYSAALGVGGAGNALAQSGLAGLPALLLDKVSAPVATLVALLAVGLLVGLASNRAGFRSAMASEPLLPMALALAAALAITPYLHLNDLVLEALPVLLLAARRQTLVGRVALLAWALGTPTRLVVGALVSPLLTSGAATPIPTAGFGVALTGLTLLALAISRDEAYSPAAAPPEASQRR